MNGPPRAAALPKGSIVATADRVWIKTGRAQWQTNGSAETVKDARVDQALSAGRAHVVRHGYGEGQQ